ncbi:hypothetical protein CC78DRAFT_574297 [Lojkania enalia]|uniref:AMP-activated protein kinase glycogen-binding domain-containing protein n=1 Tax=Lojkania enalia TaxID=147567 RepID=A0A9P4TQM0_9PLEO|nr:hypothetical protein CC78DRAFT_574297 [Didymosphaeria enalia]
MSFLKHRPHRKHIRALWHGHKPKASASTDDIFRNPEADTTSKFPPLVRAPSDPTSKSVQRRRSFASFRTALSTSAVRPNDSMAGHATITFSQPGVQPPVFVVTSISSQPWETLEMNADGKKSASGDLVFTRQFANVPEGDYQYKIRIGDGHWVVDESKDSATDDWGNRNNVLHVRPPEKRASVSNAQGIRQDSVVQHSDDVVQSEPVLSKPPQADEAASVLARGDNGFERDSRRVEELPSVPVPFTVVESVEDKTRPEYGLIEHETLPEDASKRTADAEPDIKTTIPQSPVEAKHEQPPALSVPTLVVEKTHDEPAWGDDFGEHASSAQKLAHEQRAADASPDEVVDLSKREASILDEDTAPLFRHESFNAHNANQATTEPHLHMDTIEEEPVRSSTNQTLSQLPKPPSINESEKAETHDEESLDELENGPLLPHETGLDELEKGPLLSFETGLSHQEIDVDVDADADEDGVEIGNDRHYSALNSYEEVEDGHNDLDRVPTFPHEELVRDEFGSEIPLLPHERASIDASISSGSEASDIPRIEHEPISPFSNASGRRGSSLFADRVRTNSLPLTLPRSDEEDEDLLDPSLEAFPAERDAILARVASIHSELPPDETREVDHLHSPGLSVASQACSSSISLPLSSSLKAVVEEESSEDDSSSELPSPMLNTTGASARRMKNAIGEPETPVDLSSTKASTAAPETHPQKKNMEFSDARTVQMPDSAKEGSKKWGDLYNSIATPAKTLNPLTPPLTPDKNSATAKGQEAKLGVVDDQTEYAPALTNDLIIHSQAPPRSRKLSENSSESEDRAPTPTGISKPDNSKESWLQGFVRVVFGPVGRLLASCLGGRKQAR